MELVLTAIGLMLVVEGLLYALVPGQLKRLMARMHDMSDERLRTLGTVVLGVGVLVIWLARTFLQG